MRVFVAGAGGAIGRRLVPQLVANGHEVVVHIGDAATVAALERGAPGVYNIVDDEPAPVSEWLPCLATQLGAPRPRRLPAWLARLAVGEVCVSMMTRIRGASMRRQSGSSAGKPHRRSWRDGFREEFENSETSVQWHRPAQAT
jgi:nucleoside-diphosphate-sugar epimerase